MQLTDILLNDGLVSESQLTAAYDEHQRDGRSLGRVLVDQGVLSESQLVAALAQQVGLPFVDLSEYSVDGSAIGRVPGGVCRRHVALPIAYEDGRLLVAMADPGNVFALDDFRSITGMDVAPGRRHQGRRPGGDRPVLPRRRRHGRHHRVDGGRVRGGRPLQRPRGRRGRADRQVRQPADHPGHPGPGLGHPHRADRARPARALPHRRRAARGHALAPRTSSPASSPG